MADVQENQPFPGTGTPQAEPPQDKPANSPEVRDEKGNRDKDAEGGTRKHTRDDD